MKFEMPKIERVSFEMLESVAGGSVGPGGGNISLPDLGGDD